MRAEKLFPILSVTAETIMIVPRTDRTAGSERATCVLIHPSMQYYTKVVDKTGYPKLDAFFKRLVSLDSYGLDTSILAPILRGTLLLGWVIN
jgi:hypothetical protein